MDRKLADYLAAGTKLVGYVYPAAREIHVHASPNDVQVLGRDATLTGGEVLPGFELQVGQYFAAPQA